MREVAKHGELSRDVFGDERLGHTPFLLRWWRSVDSISILAVAGLCLMGLLLGMASSAMLAERHNLGDFYFVRKQMIFSGMAVAVMLSISMLPERLLRTATLAGMGLTLFAIVLLPLFGTDFGKGAIRWYSVGGLSLQPSEFFKPMFAVVTGSLMAGATREKDINGIHGSILILLVVITLLALQPDFGQAALICSAWFIMYLVSGSSLVGLFGIAAVLVAGGVFSYFNSQHVARRINTFLSREVDPNEQIGYSVRAIENGGMFGAGIGEGSVKFALPDAHTDFIVAVAAEEYGFVMVCAIIMIYLTILLRSFTRLMIEPQHHRRIVGAGLVGLVGMQALINIGVSVRFFPAKGMTLPFISYGGSSALAMGITMGLLLAFTRQGPRESPVSG